MKFKSIIYIILLLNSPVLLVAQTLPSILPEDVRSHNMKQVKCYCDPGVRYASKSRGVELSYMFTEGGAFTSQDTFIINDPASEYQQWQAAAFKLNFPIVNKDDFKLLVGYKYEVERFSFQQIGVDYSEAFRSIDDDNLKSNSLSLLAVKPWNENTYSIFRVSYKTNGNYDGWAEFNGDYAIYNGLATYAIKKDPLFEYGFGVAFSRSFRRTSFVPLILYNRTFNEKWGIESVLPSYIFARYNVNKKNITLFGVEYDSQSYRLKIDNPATSLDYAMNHSEVLMSARWESQLSDWIWFSAKAGYRMNFSTDFESKSPTTPFFTSDPTNGLFFRLGVFLSPPDDYGKQ